MKKYLIGVAIALSMSIASVATVSATRAITTTNEVARVAEASSSQCTGPKSGGECRSENARPCGDGTGCGGSGGGVSAIDVIGIIIDIIGLIK